MARKDVSKIILGTGSYDNVKGGDTASVTVDVGNVWEYFDVAYKKLVLMMRKVC